MDEVRTRSSACILQLQLGCEGKPRINSLWPTDTMRWQGTESTLAQVMACCLMAPSHYLNQCWLIISQVLAFIRGHYHENIWRYQAVKQDWKQGWGQIRFIKYKYKYKYKNLDFSNTNTNTNILLKFDSNTNTNTNTLIQIQIQIRSTKYICRKLFGSKIGQFYISQDKCSWSVFPPNI